VENLDQKMTRRLLRWGLLDAQRAAAAKPLDAHLEDYRRSMLARGDCARHVAQEASKLKKIVAACRFRAWSDVSASRLTWFLADMRDKGASTRTSNAHLVAFKAFCAWCVRDGRISESPVTHLRGLNEKTDIRRKRRALSADDLRRLIRAAETGADWRGMPGRERAMMYRLAAETGLRWGELCSLRRASFGLGAEAPRVTVEAAYTKNRRDDVLPLRPETAAAVRGFFETYPALPEAAAFLHVPPGRVGAKIMRLDLKAAGIDYVDKSGAVADFHSLRHSFCSALARGGVHPKVAQDLARHSDINLTMRTYSHTLLSDRGTALEALPDLSLPPCADAAEAKATGTDGRLCHLLGQDTPMKGDYPGPIRTPARGERREGEGAKTPANIGETQHFRGEKAGVSEGIRTPDPQSHSLVL